MSQESFNWFIERAVEYLLQPISSWENVTSSLESYLGDWTSLTHPTGWWYWITSYLIAWALLIRSKRKGDVPSGVSFLQFAFPREVWRHPSAVLDYKFVAFHRAMVVLIYAPLMLGAVALFSKGVAQFVPSGLSADYLIGVPFGYISFTLILFLAIDFGVFLVHYLLHRIPLLWHFHKVHHSAEVLTPITEYRQHPIEYFLYSAAQVLAAQLVTGVYVVLNHENAHLMTLFGINVFVILFNSCAYQLRHSHIWFSYGPILDYFLISPAHHQIHHSIDPRHFNRNFGVTFAIWDALAGSLYVPQCREKLQFGLPDENPADYSSIAKLYVLPFKKAVGSFQSRMLPRRML
ncbi:MAG: sterol desaturase family protein [Nitrospira sp.]|nr:sterol desaturase family protein [Nitrospira sp.]